MTTRTSLANSIVKLITKNPKFLIFLLLVGGIGYGTYHFFIKEKKDEIIIEHNFSVTEIQKLGKLEIIKYKTKDIINYEKKRDFYLPDSEILLFYTGELTSCIDLSKINDNDITRNENEVVIKLPKPEICYHKVNLAESKVYKSKTWILLDNESELMDDVYKQAENALMSSTVVNPLLEETKKTAPEILIPIFTKITGKKTMIKF